MASSLQFDAGSVIGTGAAISVVTEPPKFIFLFNSTGVLGWWLKDMPDASMQKMIQTGTGSVVTSNGITPTSTGFTIGTDGDMNVSGERIRWAAIA